MKFTLVVLGSLVAIAAAGTIKSDPEVSGWMVPTVNGQFTWMPKEQYDMESAGPEPRAASAKFFLYTRSNPNSPRQINTNDGNALNSSPFSKNRPTRFIIHGWQNNYQSDVNIEVRSALLAQGDYNVFCVDWSANAETINYASARWSVGGVGALVANFIDFLNASGGMSFSSLAVIGHSLGAHVSGFAGKNVRRGRIPVIIGLDPALPLFSYNDCGARLCSSDANYVESIQTNGGLLGFLEPIGKSAFYPNGGKTQPGCGIDATGGCAHARSYQYYAEAVRRNDFPSMKCGNYQDAVNKNCGNSYSSVRMGSPSNTATSGAYYVPVKSSPPYGMYS